MADRDTRVGAGLAASDLAPPRYQADPADRIVYADPYPHYAAMRALGPLVLWDDYALPCLTTHAGVSAALRDRRLGREATHVMSRAEAGLPDIPAHLEPFYAFEAHSMLEREPPAHTRLRGLVNRAFVSRHIEALRPAIESLAHDLIDRIEPGLRAGGSVDLLPAFCEPIPVIVIARLLGVPEIHADRLLAWSHAMVAMYQFNRTRAIEDAAIEATAAFGDFIRAIAEERRRTPRDDLLTRLVEAEAAGDRLSMDELVTTAILLLNAGHEATVHGLGNGVKALLEADGPNPFAMPERDMDAALAAADELLRFDPPLHLFTRFVLEDCVIEGVPLRRGSQVGLLLGSANRDPARYADPDRLDFTRGAAGHVAFGAGIHFCLGAPLARLEMAVALRVLFARLPGLALAEEPIFADRFHFHGLERLTVRLR